MLKEEMLKRSPLRILENTIQGGLGKGNLGVFTARKGVGKTACLVHVAIDELLRPGKVLHISFADNPQHIESWYNQVFQEVAKVYNLENAIDNYDEIIKNRLILHFKQPGADLKDILPTLNQFTEGASFHPEVIIVDGYPFYEKTPDQLAEWKKYAVEKDAAVWFSATLHREKLDLDHRGIPAPVNKFYDLFSVIIMLNPMQDLIDFNLLKDHDSPEVDKLMLKLDPKTLLIANGRGE